MIMEAGLSGFHFLGLGLVCLTAGSRKQKLHCCGSLLSFTCVCHLSIPQGPFQKFLQDAMDSCGPHRSVSQEGRRMDVEGQRQHSIQYLFSESLLPKSLLRVIGALFAPFVIIPIIDWYCKTSTTENVRYLLVKKCILAHVHMKNIYKHTHTYIYVWSMC